MDSLKYVAQSKSLASIVDVSSISGRWIKDEGCYTHTSGLKMEIWES